MDAFVGELSRLYRLACAASVEEFPERVVTQLRDWIAFDGAVFGFGESGAKALKIGSSAIYNRDPAILRDYEQVSHTDTTTQRFMQTPGAIMNVDTQSAYTGKENRPLAKFSSNHDLRHLLLLGEETSDRSRLRWITSGSKGERMCTSSSAGRASSSSACGRACRASAWAPCTATWTC